MDQDLWKAWLRFTEQALHGTEQARRQFEQMTGGNLDPEALGRWLAQWMPGAQGSPREDGAAELTEAMERWWEALGVVPRHKYEAVLRQNDALKERLEETERKIADLRRRMAAEADDRHREEVGEMLTQWEKATHEALDAQVEWAARWFGTPKKQEDKR